MGTGDRTHDQWLHTALPRRSSVPFAVAPQQQQQQTRQLQHQLLHPLRRQPDWRAAAMTEDEAGGISAAAVPPAMHRNPPPPPAQHSVKSVSSPPNPFRVAAAADLPNPFHGAAAADSCRAASAPAQAQSFSRFSGGGGAAAFRQQLGSRPPWGSATPSQQLSEMTAVGSLALSDAGRLANDSLPMAQQHSAAPSHGDSLLAKLQVHRASSRTGRKHAHQPFCTVLTAQ